MHGKWLGRSLIPAALLALGAMTAEANAEDIVLRVADFYPVGHKTPEYSVKFWMEEVAKRTDGEVTFEYYPAQQLGKAADLLALSLSGVVDVAGYGTSYVSDRMPLSSVAELPGAFSTSCEGTLAYWRLATEGVLRQEYEDNDSRLLFVIVNPPFQLYLKDRGFRSPEDLVGMKIRTTGGAQEATINALGGVPVRMAGPEIYEALSRGTLDGVLFPVTSLFSYDLHQHVRYATVGESFGAGVLPYSMSEERWRSLPEHVRAVMQEVGEATTRRACAMIDNNVTPAVERLKAEGIKIVNPEGAGRDAFRERVRAVGQRWAEDLDARGMPGSEVLEAFTAELSR